MRQRAITMRGYEEMRGRVVGWGAFFHPFGSFLRSCVCGKVQKAEGPTRKLDGDPVQGFSRDYELLIGFFVDWFDGFYLYLFLQAKFSRCEGRGVEFRRSEASASRIRMSWRDGGHRVAGAAIPFKKKVSREVVLHFLSGAGAMSGV